MTMDKDYFEKFMNYMKAELIKKIEDTGENLNKRIDKNTTYLRAVEDLQSEHVTAIENLTTRSEQNTDDIIDMKLRLDRLDKERGLNEQRFASIEEVMDLKKEEQTPPKVKQLINDVNKLKEDNLDEVTSIAVIFHTNHDISKLFKIILLIVR